MNEMKWILSHIYNFLSGIFVASIGYFLPVLGMIHLVIIAITIDLIFGIVAARKRREGIKSKKLWRTMYKMIISVIIISLAYSMDKEIGMQLQIHRFIAWMITGFEIWSILESAGEITNHKLFRLLQHFMEDKVKNVTGIDIKNDCNENNK